jgi:hypothetical protein
MTIDFGNGYILYILGIIIIVLAIACAAKKLIKFAITLFIVASIFFYGGTFIENVKAEYGSGELLENGEIDFNTEAFAFDIKQFITNMSIGDIRDIQKIEVSTSNKEVIDEIILNITYKDETSKEVTVDMPTYNKLKELLGDKFQEGKDILSQHSN